MAVSVARLGLPVSGRPKLLLDTNVLRKLAHGDLRSFEDRLLALATPAAGRLIWFPEVALQELLFRIANANERTFPALIEALRWADRLAGTQVAEGYDYALRVGAATEPRDRNKERRLAINEARGRLVKVDRLAEMPPDLLAIAKSVGDMTDRQRATWAQRCRKRASDLAKPDPTSEQLVGQQIVNRVVQIMCETFVEVADRHSTEHGPSRTAEEIRTNLREFLYFDAALIVKGLGRNGYNFEGHRTDFHDYVLCAYPAAGYSVITCDGRLRHALEMTQCPAPRVFDLVTGLGYAEEWLADSA